MGAAEEAEVRPEGEGARPPEEVAAEAEEEVL